MLAIDAAATAKLERKLERARRDGVMGAVRTAALVHAAAAERAEGHARKRTRMPDHRTLFLF